MGLIGLLLGGAPAWGADFYVGTEVEARDSLDLIASGDTLFLTDSFEVFGPLEIEERLEVAGQGHTITSTGNFPAFVLSAPVILRDVVLDSNHTSGRLVEVQGLGSSLSGIRVCGVSGTQPLIAFDAEGTILNSVFEDVGGTVISLPTGTLTNVTVQGDTASLELSAAVNLFDSVSTVPIGVAFASGSVVPPSVPDVLGGTNPLCPGADSRPAVSGNLWDAGGLHVGGYRGDLDAEDTAFAGWNDADDDGAPYGPSGRAADGWDCDDGDSHIGPDAEETCNGQDDDCDGDVDEEPAAKSPGAVAGFVDADGDGYGSSEPCWVCGDLVLDPTCVAEGDDCDDADPTVWEDADCETADTGTTKAEPTVPTDTGDDDDDVDPTQADDPDARDATLTDDAASSSQGNMAPPRWFCATRTSGWTGLGSALRRRR